MADNTVVLEDSKQNKEIVLVGTYRQIEAKIKEILLDRKNSEFFTKTHTDGSSNVTEYHGFTDISNFLVMLRTKLIPSEEAESEANVYSPIKVSGGCIY